MGVGEKDISEFRENADTMGVMARMGRGTSVQLEGVMTPGMMRDTIGAGRRPGETLDAYERRTGYIRTGHNTGYSPTGPSR